jgi:hypothetical protein
MPIGTRRSCLTKKTGHEKSRDTVPLGYQIDLADLHLQKKAYCRSRRQQKQIYYLTAYIEQTVVAGNGMYMYVQLHIRVQ